MADRIVGDGREVHHGIDALEVVGCHVPQVAVDGSHGLRRRTEVAADIEAGVETDGLVAGRAQHGHEDCPDVALVTCDQHAHAVPPLIMVGPCARRSRHSDAGSRRCTLPVRQSATTPSVREGTINRRVGHPIRPSGVGHCGGPRSTASWVRNRVKVVLFCGGQGLRIREYNETVPKPMVPVGSRPILWHVMRLYAQHGFNDFVLCLGYQAEVIKDYFLRYNEAISNDFVLRRGGRELTLLNSDMDDWQITFVDTGRNANVGERLVAVRQYLEDDEVFLANYADTLTDAPLAEHVEAFCGEQQASRPSWRSGPVTPSMSSRRRPMARSRPSSMSATLRSGSMAGTSSSAVRSSTTSGRRGAGGGAVPAPAGRAPPDGLPVRRVLGADGHLEGQAGA